MKRIERVDISYHVFPLYLRCSDMMYSYAELYFTIYIVDIQFIFYAESISDAVGAAFSLLLFFLSLNQN